MAEETYYYFTDVDLSLDDGPGINEREFAKALIAAPGVSVKCFVPAPAYPERLPASASFHFVPRYRKGAIGYLLYAWNVIRVAVRTRRARPSALVIRPMAVPFTPLLLRWIYGVPLLLKTLAGYSMFEAKQQSVFRRFVAILSLPFIRRVIRTAAFIDTPSESYAIWQKQKFGIDESRLAVVPNGVNIRMFQARDRAYARKVTNLPPDARIVGYVGAIAGLRNLDLLVPAVKQLSERVAPGAFLMVLVGSGKDASALRESVEQAGVCDYFHFAGKVAYDTVPDWMSSFDATLDLTLVQMKMPDGTLLDASFSQKIPQYLAVGRPVIAMRCADNAHLEERRTGWLVERSRATDRLSAIFEEIVSMSDAEWADTSERCRRYVTEELDIQQLVAKRLALWWKARERSGLS